MRKEDWQFPVFILGLLMGTASTLLIKATYDHGAIDPITLTPIKYEKPLFLTFLMFLGMFGSLPLYMFLTRNQKSSNKIAQNNENDTTQEKSPLLPSSTVSNDKLQVYTPSDPFGDLQPTDDNTQNNSNNNNDEEEEQFNIFSFKLMMLLMIPAIFDLLGTILSTIGLLYVSVSLYQLTRCSVIVVTAIFKRFLLGHKLTRANYAGVVLNTIAMLIVGAAAIILEPKQSTIDPTTTQSTSTITGMLLILASAVIQGAQYVFEEKVMSFDNVPPLVLIGFEGLNGCLLSIFVVFPFATLMPGSDNGYYEDIWGAFTLPFYSTGLLSLIIAFSIIIFLYNVFCIYITFLLSSIYHCIMDGLRPCAVWLTSLASFYILGWSGQPWSTICWFELISMALILYGTAVYSGQAHLPCLDTKSLLDLDSTEDDDYNVHSIPVRDTPTYLARVGHATPRINNNEQVNPSEILTQSPAFRATHHHGHNSPQLHGHGHNSPQLHGHSHNYGSGNNNNHGHTHSGVPIAHQAPLSSRAQQANNDRKSMM